MTNDRHFHPAIYDRLRALTEQRDWQGLTAYVDTLSHAQFRTAGYMLGERLLPDMDEAEVWAMAAALTEHDARAFLGTMLKALALRLERETLHLHSGGGCEFLRLVASQPIDRQKTLTALLPVVRKPEDVVWLFRKLGVDEGEPRIAYLLRPQTMAVAYVLFRSLRYVEHNRPLLVRVAVFLMKRGDALAYNMASLLRACYGLQEVKGTFSLRVEPYQLARMEASYEAFCKAMRL